MDLDFAFKLLKSKGYRILPNEGNWTLYVNKDKKGYNIIIIPEDPEFSIVILGFDRETVMGLRDKIDSLLKDEEGDIHGNL